VTFAVACHSSFYHQLERKAERFALVLLLPESEVRKEINSRIKAQKEITYSDLVDMARAFGVSTIALLYLLANFRLARLGRGQTTL